MNMTPAASMPGTMPAPMEPSQTVPPPMYGPPTYGPPTTASSYEPSGWEPAPGPYARYDTSAQQLAYSAYTTTPVKYKVWFR